MSTNFTIFFQKCNSESCKDIDLCFCFTLYNPQNTFTFIVVSDILNLVNELCAKRSLFKVWFGPKLIICLTDNNDIRTILNSKKCLAKDEFYYNVVKQATRDGLLTSAGK